MSQRDDNRTAMQSSSLGENVIRDRGRGRREKLGEVARGSDFKPDGFAGVAADSGVGRSPVAADISLSGLSESGRRLRPTGRWRTGKGELETTNKSL